MLDPYLDAMALHIAETTEDLDSIKDLLHKRSWSRIERKGAERLLQILIEAAIGLAKHRLKQSGQMVPADAYAAFTKLEELQAMPAETSIPWRSIVGMRNAIVHDYLNLDPEIIKSVITQGLHLDIRDFANAIIDQLRKGSE